MASQVLRENSYHHVIVIPLLLLLRSFAFWTDAAPVAPAAETPKRSNLDSAPLKFGSCWGEAYSSEYSCENVIKASEQDNPHLKPFISKGDQNESVEVTFVLSKPSTLSRVTFSIEGYKGFYYIQSDKCFGSLSGIQLFAEGYRDSPGMSSPGGSLGIGASLGEDSHGIGASLGKDSHGIGASLGGDSHGIGASLKRGLLGLSGSGTNVGGPVGNRLLDNRFILQCDKVEDGDSDESVTFACDTGPDGYVDRIIISRKPLSISAMLELGRHTSQRLTLVKVKAYTD